MNMQFRDRPAEADFKDVRVMTRSKIYWLKVFLANWYGIALLLALVGGDNFGALGPDKA